MPRWENGLLTEPAVGGPAFRGDIFAFGPALRYGDLMDECGSLWLFCTGRKGYLICPCWCCWVFPLNEVWCIRSGGL